LEINKNFLCNWKNLKIIFKKKFKGKNKNKNIDFVIFFIYREMLVIKKYSLNDIGWVDILINNWIM
jgi:hypothetical protein